MARALAAGSAASVLIAAAAAAAGPASCPDLEGHWGWGGSYAVELSDGLALFDSGPTLLVAEWSDPSRPRVLGSARLAGEPADICRDGDLAFVAIPDFGIEIIDVSNPAFPRTIGEWRSENIPTAVAAVAGHAYVAGTTSGLEVIDVSDPSRPTEVAALDLGPQTGALDVAVEDGFAFVAASDGLVIVDVTQPALPVETDRVELDRFAFRLAVDGTTCWVLSGGTELIAVDITDPFAAAVVGGLDLPGSLLDVDAARGVVHVAAYSSGLYVVDGADPARPVLVSTLELPGWTLALSAHVDSVLVALGAGGVSAVTTSSPSSPSIEGGWTRPSPSANAADAVAMGDLVVLADGSARDGRVRVFDLHDPRRPTELGWAGLPADGMAVDVLPGLAVAAHMTINFDIPEGGGITTVDLTDPVNPGPLATLDLPGFVTDVVTAGQAAYVVHDGGIDVVGLSEPSEPERTARWAPEHSYLESVDVDAGIVFAGGSFGELCAADVRVPSAPVHLGCSEAADAMNVLTSLDVRGPLAAAVADPGGGSFGRLLVMDVADPAHPAVLADVPLGGRGGGLWLADVLLTGSLAVVTLGTSYGVQIFDVGDPATPRLIGTFDSGSYRSGGLATARGRLFVAAGIGGLESFRIEGCRHPLRPDERRRRSR